MRKNKHMKKIIVLVLTLLLTLSLFALAPEGCLFVGAKIGATVNNVIAGDNYLLYKYSSRPGLRLSIPVNYQIARNYAVESGISVSSKNYHLERDHKQQMINLNLENDFISVPLILNLLLPCDESFTFHISFGTYVGWWCKGNSKGTVFNLNKKQQEVNERTNLELKNRLEYGVLGSLGFTIDLPHSRFIIGIEYEQDMSNMNKKQEVGEYQIYNSTLLFTTALLWRVK